MCGDAPFPTSPDAAAAVQDEAREGACGRANEPRLEASVAPGGGFVRETMAAAFGCFTLCYLVQSSEEKDSEVWRRVVLRPPAGEPGPEQRRALRG